MLSEYLEQPPESVKTGDVTRVKLANARLLPKVLEDMGLPVRLLFGHIGELDLKLQLDIFKIRTDPLKAVHSVDILIRELYLVVEPRNLKLHKITEEELTEQIKAVKDRLFGVWLAEMAEKRSELLAGSKQQSGDKQQQQQESTWDKIAAILQRSKIRIESIHIRYEDRNLSNGREPFSLGAVLAGLDVHPRNSAGMSKEKDAKGKKAEKGDESEKGREKERAESGKSPTGPHLDADLSLQGKLSGFGVYFNPLDFKNLLFDSNEPYNKEPSADAAASNQSDKGNKNALSAPAPNERAGSSWFGRGTKTASAQPSGKAADSKKTKSPIYWQSRLSREEVMQRLQRTIDDAKVYQEREQEREMDDEAEGGGLDKSTLQAALSMHMDKTAVGRGSRELNVHASTDTDPGLLPDPLLPTPSMESAQSALSPSNSNNPHKSSVTETVDKNSLIPGFSPPSPSAQPPEGIEAGRPVISLPSSPLRGDSGAFSMLQSSAVNFKEKETPGGGKEKEKEKQKDEIVVRTRVTYVLKPVGAVVSFVSLATNKGGATAAASPEAALAGGTCPSDMPAQYSLEVDINRISVFYQQEMLT
uniref:Chorein N-terminal domain-containing protein n=1 Tax=Chromera velia CCMP2878 TaxID=1169474 RepID=A0A0G4F7K2_9ALVE|eukprot:Cvel_15469.t1-p1 / transcript=Cvel_15469.t1 / gene=Cvel_15469 / organism=Chromera_velia_CCMP2878 / gene_product=hypothetical protein / transcript_product=hypothetical protein / location=Cvel_scaffold1146:52296-54056(-) / protein_length=587 / sequence_SO=supercontig / SO=protein_coding / is_pseudo=false